MCIFCEKCAARNVAESIFHGNISISIYQFLWNTKFSTFPTREMNCKEATAELVIEQTYLRYLKTTFDIIT